MKKCPKCHQQIEDNSQFCEYCGCDIGKHRKKIVIIIASIIVVLLACLAVVLIINNNKKESEKEKLYFYRSSSLADYREYMNRYPDGEFAKQAADSIERLRNDSIREAEAFRAEMEENAFNNCTSAKLCRQYLKDYPGGSYASEVVAKLEKFVADSLLSMRQQMNNEMENRIHSFVENFSRLTETSDKQMMRQMVYELFAPSVKRYYSTYDTDSDYVADCFARYDEAFSVYGKHSSVRWNTVSYNTLGDRIYLTYVEDYSIDREDRSKYSVFVLEKHFELNMDYKVVSVYDVQLSKSKK